LYAAGAARVLHTIDDLLAFLPFAVQKKSAAASIAVPAASSMLLQAGGAANDSGALLQSRTATVSRTTKETSVWSQTFPSWDWCCPVCASIIDVA